MRKRQGIFALGSLCLYVFCLAGLVWSAQEEPKASNDEVFSGNVVTCSDVQVTVTRKGLARETVTKTFVIDSETKTEGLLKPKARVTVRFVAAGENLRAIHIIVR